MVQDNPKIILEYVQNAAIATLTDEKILEETDIQAIESTIIPLIEQTTAINLVLDFANVQFLSSAVLGSLIRISKKVYELNGQLRLCNINQKILQIFTITRLDKIFEIFEDRQSALNSLD